MCFHHDHQWYAAICEIDRAAMSDAPVACDECHRPIPPGDTYTSGHQQEHDPHDPDEDNPPDAEFDPGEECDWAWCRDCQRLLDAIRAAEEAEGCKGDSTQPALFELYDAMHDDRREGGRYAARAREMFPDLDNLHLARMAGLPEEEDATDG